MEDMTNTLTDKPDLQARGRDQVTGDENQKTRQKLPPAAQRALAEAAERRKKHDAQLATAEKAREVGGPAGPDPIRYGDWEKKGIASDF